MPMVLAEEASFIAWGTFFTAAGPEVFAEAAAVGVAADAVVEPAVGAAVDKAGVGAEALEEVVTDEINSG